MIDKPLLRQCCVCRKVYIGERWLPEPKPIDFYYESYLRSKTTRRVSHGYCDGCIDEVMDPKDLKGMGI